MIKHFNNEKSLLSGESHGRGFIFKWLSGKTAGDGREFEWFNRL